MKDQLLLSIVIVNWNTRDDLVRCLESIEQTDTPEEREIIVVDNASYDGSCQVVRERFPRVILIANIQNKGFAGGVNDGLRMSRGEYVLILNPDIILTRRSVQMLIPHLQNRRDAGAIMPRLINPDGSTQGGYLRKFPGALQVFFFATMLESWSRAHPFLVNAFLESPLENDKSLVEVEQIPGACLMTSRLVIDRVGMMEEDYWMFYEDVDWCYRLKENGYKLFMDCQTTVIHVGGQSFLNTAPTWKFGRFKLSLLLFFDRHKWSVESLFVKVILVVNSLIVFSMRSLLQLLPWSGRGTGARASREKHLYFLRMVYWTYVNRKDILELK